MLPHTITSPPAAPSSTTRPSRPTTAPEPDQVVEHCPIFDAAAISTHDPMSYNPDSPGLEKAPSKLPSNTPPSAAQGYITVSDISQLFSRFEATQAARDAQLQGQLRHEIEVLRTQVIDLSSQLHSSNAGTDSNSAGTPLNSTLNSSEAESPPISSTPSSLGIGTYLGDEHRFSEPELSPSRYIETLVPLNVLAPKLISQSSSRCVSDIDSLLAWTRKQYVLLSFKNSMMPSRP